MAEETTDPGAARNGNFINYYSFNPAEARTQLLPSNLLAEHGDKKMGSFVALDVGCNSGELTVSLQKHLASSTPSVLIHGIDLDPVLIERAKSLAEKDSANVAFHHLDIMSDGIEQHLDALLEQHGKKKFDAMFCFSVTMWIHLNHGDCGLERFISVVARYAELVLLEPQPWRCYQTAARRMRKLGHPDFQHMKEMRHTGDKLEDFLFQLCEKKGLRRICDFGTTDWKRKLVLLKCQAE